MQSAHTVGSAHTSFRVDAKAEATIRHARNETLEYLDMISVQCLTFSKPASSSALPVTMSKYPKIELNSKPPTPALISGLTMHEH